MNLTQSTAYAVRDIIKEAINQLKDSWDGDESVYTIEVKRIDDPDLYVFLANKSLDI
jgi:hypothetical protein